MRELLILGLFICLIIALIVFVPIVALWALSVLGLPVVYGVKQWFAMFLLIVIFGHGKISFGGKGK